jgi:hypothetical protein
MFPFIGILQHYIEFDTCTIAMLENLLGARYFGGSIGPLIHHHTTFFISSNEFNLFFGLLSPHSWGVGH